MNDKKLKRLEVYYNVFDLSTLQKSKVYYEEEIECILESHNILEKENMLKNMTSRLTAIQSVIKTKLNSLR